MNRTFRSVAMLAALGAFALVASGCNTIKGVGKDTQKVGEEIEEAAEEHDRTQSDSRTSTESATRSGSKSDVRARPAR